MSLRVQELNSYLVLFNGDRLLLLKRPEGYWEFPGGSVDFGEEPQDAAIREALEETGLTAKSVSFVTVTSAKYKKGEDDKHSVYIVYRGDTEGSDVILSKEHTEYRWLTKLEAKFMKLALNAESVLQYL